MRRHHRFAVAVAAAFGLLVPLLPVGAAAAASGEGARELTNLAHLDSLTATVAPPRLPGHETYRQDAMPDLGVLWVYADHLADGTYRPTGGGTYDPASGTYGQGAYDADDIARAAVVYLRHWRADHDEHSRREAYQLLRGLTYLQTSTGPDAGNVVLWMQPDGTLNPSPTPKDNPDPSDSGASYWVARTIWALGEGYAAFKDADPHFAAFLRERLDLAVAAVDREVLVRYGQYRTIHGARVPAWLIADGADASAEAVLGLNAYLRALPGQGNTAARTTLSQLADGIAAMGAGSPRQWPYGAILPWASSRSDWHAWGLRCPPPWPSRPARSTARGCWIPRWRTRPCSHRRCSRRPDRTTAGCPPPRTVRRSPTAPTPGCRACSRWPRRPVRRGCGSSRVSPPAGSSARTRRVRRHTTRRPASPTTG
ncbi:hypothetical protein ACFQ0G_19265 [Streptomyces chiangmaiensis]